MKNIAILTPGNNTYSETFILAHKRLNKNHVKFYFGNSGNIRLEEGSNFHRKRPVIILLKALGKIIRKSNYDVEFFLLNSWKANKVKAVLVEYGTTAADFLPVLIKAKVPFVVHFHGYDASKNEVIEKNREIYKKIFGMAEKIIVVSRPMHEKIISLGCPEEKILYNVYGPDEKFLSVKPLFQEKLFIAVGRFVDKKGPYYSILAFNEVNKKNPDSRLIMAGSGPLLNTCKNLVKAFGLEDKVFFPGIITPEMFREYLSRGLAFIQHSITAQDGDMEGSPVAIIEASAVGIPVISTYHAGIPEVIINNETGFLVEEHDYKSMAEKMSYLLENPDFAKKMGENGKQRIKNNFTLKKHLLQLDNVFTELIAK